MTKQKPAKGLQDKKASKRPKPSAAKSAAAKSAVGESSVAVTTASPAMPLTGDVSDPLIRLFSLPTILARPVWLTQSPWIEHVPFAFWVIEALAPKLFVELGVRQGASYFAFCQAAERQGLDLQAFGIDSRDGDSRDGQDGAESELRGAVHEHNDRLYSGFSRLIESRFDDARDQFGDGTIDLLHINGDHGYAAVRHDFDSWLPKLSPKAVVLLHGSNLRERDAGVFRLVAELGETYPVFDFSHGHGLAVIGVGPRQNASFERLFAAQSDAVARQAIHLMFGRLGRACADAANLQLSRDLYRKAEAEIARLSQDLARQGTSGPAAEASDPGLTSLREAISAERDSYRTHIAQLTAAQDSMTADLRAAQDTIAGLQQEASALRRQVEAVQAATEQQVQARTHPLQARLREVEAAAATERAALIAQLDGARLEAAEIRQAAEQAQQAMRSRMDAAIEEAGRARPPVDTTVVEAAKATLASGTVKHDQLAQERDQLVQERDQAVRERDQNLREREQTEKALNQNLRERTDEVSTLTRMVMDLRKAAVGAEARLTETSGARDAAMEEANIWRERYEGVLRSTSWRVSAPVRMVSRVMRRSGE